jgi:hypothetical protein
MLWPFMSWTFRAAAVLPLAALALLLATTSGETAIRPRPLAGLAAVLLVGVLAAGSKSKRWLDLGAAALLGIAASHLLLFPGLPRAHDIFHHVWGVWAVAREARVAGDLMPLWVHGLGMGMPLLQFYGPAGFAVSLPFSLAGLAPAAALKATFLTFGAVASAGMYLAAQRWTGDRRAGLVAAAAYAFAPYRLIDVHYRAAFGESAGLAVLPFVLLFGSAAVREGGWRRLSAGAAAAALLVVTHPISALIAAIGMGIWTVAELALDPRGYRDVLVRIGRLAGVWLLGAALAGFFVVPFAAESRYTSVERLARGEEMAIFTGYGLTLPDLLERRLWARLHGTVPTDDPRDGTDEEMPYYFGLVLLSLIPLGAGFGRLPKGLAWTTLAALALSLRPVATAASIVFPPLAVLQFPWRFLGLAAFGAAALAGAATVRLLDAAEGRRWVVLVPGALAALLAFDAFPYTGAPEWFPGYEGLSFVRRTNPGGSWEVVPIDPPYAVRSSGLLLPPTDPGIDTSYFCCAFPEFQTPLVRALTRESRQPDVLIRAGVGIFVGPGRQTLVRLPAAPYAALRHGRNRPEPRPFTRGGGEIRVWLDGRPGLVTVLEEYFPGWQVLTDEGWKEVRPTRTGLLRARVAAGQTEARFRFRRWTRARTAGWLLTGLTALGLTSLCAWRPRRRAAPPPDRG